MAGSDRTPRTRFDGSRGAAHIGRRWRGGVRDDQRVRRARRWSRGAPRDRFASSDRSRARSAIASAGSRLAAGTPGSDFPEPMGTPIHAGGVGVVSFAGYNTGGYGNLVVIAPARLRELVRTHVPIAVSVGQSVSGGQTIGYVGATGHATDLTSTSRSATSARRSTRRRTCWASGSLGAARPAGPLPRAQRRKCRCRPNADARGRGADPLTARLDRCPYPRTRAARRCGCPPGCRRHCARRPGTHSPRARVTGSRGHR